MNTHSAYEYIMFVPAQHWHGWYEQRPSNSGGLDLSGMGEAGRVYFMEADLFLILFLYCSTQLLLGFVLNCTLYISFETQ
jgi:hypothetical protein